MAQPAKTVDQRAAIDAAAALRQLQLPDDAPEIRDAECNLLAMLATWPVSTVARPIERYCRGALAIRPFATSKS